jgi:hypothetical protein
MKAEKCENKKVCYTWEYAALQMLPVTTIMNLLLGPPRGCLRLLEQPKTSSVSTFRTQQKKPTYCICTTKEACVM